MMTTRHFAIVEGANLNVADQWTNAHMLRGQQRLAVRQYQEALADFQAAAKIPSNLPSARSLGFDPGGDRRAPEFAYWTGVAWDMTGDHQKAVESWKAGAQPARQGSSRRQELDPLSAAVQSYYTAICLQKLGETEKARSLFQELVATGEKGTRRGPPAPASSWSPRQALSPRAHMATAHYVSGLGYLGLADKEKAKQKLTEALRLSPDLLGMKQNDQKYQQSSIFWGNILVAVICFPFLSSREVIYFSDLWMLSFLGVFQIALAYAFFASGLKRIFAVEASIISMIEPVLNPVWVFIGYGETPSVTAIIGGIIILCAILVRSLISRSPMIKKKFNF